MKFASEKKPSLCIYTNDVVPNADEKVSIDIKNSVIIVCFVVPSFIYYLAPCDGRTFKIN